MHELKLEHLYKSFGNIQAVQDAYLDVSKKCFIVLAGPSGCGKTTLLHLIAGFLKSDQGSMYMDGVCIDTLKPDQREIAMVFQDAALFPHMSVYENIKIGLECAGISKTEIDERIQTVTKQLHIIELLSRRADALSNGQKQRVSIARALVRRPKMFLMDEPLSALDARLKAQLRLEIMQLYHKMDATFLYVTHDQMEAMTMADILIIMKDGSFQQVGKPLDIYQNPCNLFTATFLGKYELNKFQGELHGQYVAFEDKRFALLNVYDDNEIIIGVRPEHLILDDTYGVKGNVMLVEYLGDEVYYHMYWKEQMVIMKGSLHHDIHIGDTIAFSFAFHNALCFDSKSHERLALL